jgi:aryl-alcohol dehydrogenase-like predicted oxidoreductase
VGLEDSDLMRSVQLPNSDVRASILGLGCNAFGTRADRDAAFALLDRALDAGLTLVDTADMYGQGKSEEIVGEWLGSRRERVVLTTKGGGAGNAPAERGGSRDHLRRALEASLRRLRTDYIDLYYVHYYDGVTPDDETFGTLDEFKREGKIRAVGLSNYAAWQVGRTLWASERNGFVRCSVVQGSYSLIDRTSELEMLPLCRAENVGFYAFWPLGGGILTGKYHADAPPPPSSRLLTQPLFAKSVTSPRLSFAERVAAIAREHGWTPAQLALAWVLKRPGVSGALVGATKTAQLEDNLGALDIDLSDELVRELEELSAEARRTPFR